MRYFDRIIRAILLLRCVARVVLFGRADKVPEKISRVIVVPTGKLGDVVCCTPVLRAIRTHLPHARIIVAGNSKLHRPLLVDSGLVDEYLDLVSPGALGRTKRCRADVALVTGPSYGAAALLCAAGVPLVVSARVEGGFSPSETRPYKILKRLIKTFPYRIGEHAPRERLRVLESLGIFSDDTTKHLGFSESGSRKVDQFFLDHNLDLAKDFVVGMSLSSGNKIKEWPVDRFAKVADYLYEKYRAMVVIIGTKGDCEKTKEMLSFLDRKTKATDAAGVFDLDQLKAFISKLHLFISVDTGPIYIAESFNVPTIDIVGPVDERVQPPRGLIHRNVVPPHRVKPELSILNARSYNQAESLRQVLSITVPLVLETINKLIGDLPRSHRQQHVVDETDNRMLNYQ
ncbi:MAG: glycosyltransferase family 9 protein [Patescibacteria group bacterium]